MAQLGEDSFAAGDGLMSVEEAVAALFARVSAVEDIETVALAEAEGRVLAEDLAAPLDLPGFDNSAVDGYAVRFDDLAQAAETVLDIGGRAAAGHELTAAGTPSAPISPARPCASSQAPPMPGGMDTVFMQEDCRDVEDGRVGLPPGLSRGDNCRLRGEDIRTGRRRSRRAGACGRKTLASPPRSAWIASSCGGD